MPATEPDPTEETPPVAQDTEQQQQQRWAEEQRAEDQALRNYIALAPYAAPRPGTAAAAVVARVAAARRATTAAAHAHARAAKIGAISATRAQREIAALWAPRTTTEQHTDRQASRNQDDGR